VVAAGLGWPSSYRQIVLVPVVSANAAPLAAHVGLTGARLFIWALALTVLSLF
jgi:hypothetical protein